MGSITKRPKAPPRPKIARVSPAPAPEPVAETPSEPEKTDAQIAAEQRTQSLLRRSRGRQGTILTGFRGFLEASGELGNRTRKTLLGE
ncbi:MAG: hypothetical protein MRY79_09605 [Alphaproteobacteria bacterium]|nr:hypothetical protein [Alphaproteobacteria bacterium]